MLRGEVWQTGQSSRAVTSVKHRKYFLTAAPRKLLRIDLKSGVRGKWTTMVRGSTLATIPASRRSRSGIAGGFRIAAREHHPEGGAFALGRFELETRIENFTEPLHDRQSDAFARRRAPG